MCRVVSRCWVNRENTFPDQADTSRLCLLGTCPRQLRHHGKDHRPGTSRQPLRTARGTERPRLRGLVEVVSGEGPPPALQTAASLTSPPAGERDHLSLLLCQAPLPVPRAPSSQPSKPSEVPPQWGLDMGLSEGHAVSGPSSFVSLLLSQCTYLRLEAALLPRLRLTPCILAPVSGGGPRGLRPQR